MEKFRYRENNIRMDKIILIIIVDNLLNYFKIML